MSKRPSSVFLFLGRRGWSLPATFTIPRRKARGQPLTEDRQSDRMMCNTLYWSHPWHDPFGLPMKVPSNMSPQEEMSRERSFSPVQIMRSSSPIFGMPFTSMALSFMLSFSWQTMHITSSWRPRRRISALSCTPSIVRIPPIST